VAYSALNFVAMFPLISLMRPGIMPRWLLDLSLFLVGIGAPCLWALLFLSMRRHPWISARVAAPISRVWDVVFGQRQEYWIIAHLKGGRRIGGVYSKRSFTSSSPAPPEIFLEEVWDLNECGLFTEAVPSSAGILILGDEIVCLEFFHYDEPRSPVRSGIASVLPK
jgi:hypothetical protein